MRKFKESLYAVTCTTDIERVKTYAKDIHWIALNARVSLD